MLVDHYHPFQFHATVPWPGQPDNPQVDWVWGIEQIEDWLQQCVGSRYQLWAYDDCPTTYQIGVAFKWDKDRTLFVLTWGT